MRAIFSVQTISISCFSKSLQKRASNIGGITCLPSRLPTYLGIPQEWVRKIGRKRKRERATTNSRGVVKWRYFGLKNYNRDRYGNRPNHHKQLIPLSSVSLSPPLSIFRLCCVLPFQLLLFIRRGSISVRPSRQAHVRLNLLTNIVSKITNLSWIKCYTLYLHCYNITHCFLYT